MILKKKQVFFRIIMFLFLQAACLFLFSGISGASNFDSGRNETKLSAAENSPEDHLLFATGTGVPLAAVTKCKNQSRTGIYSKDIYQPYDSFLHLKKSFLKSSAKKSFVITKQTMRLHLACCVLLI